MAVARSMTRFIGRVAIPLLLPGALFVTRQAWMPLLSRWLVAGDPLQPADAVIALAGGRARVRHAAHLYLKGYARWFITADMPLNLPGINHTYGQLVQREAVAAGVPAPQLLTLSRTAHTTYDEACMARELAQERGWRRLLVVTDAYHTRRSRLIFRHVFSGSGIDVSIQPVPAHDSENVHWWQSVAGLHQTSSEYLKLLLLAIGYHA